jgi:prepilin-type N-terminal cleavage/methylation domain-containing protein
MERMTNDKAQSANQAPEAPPRPLRGAFFVCYCEEASSFVVARSRATKQSGAERGQEIAAHPAGARNDRMRKCKQMKRIRLSNKTRKTLGGSSRGFTLIEMLIALALFAIIGIVFAGGLATASRAVLIADVRTNAESLARTEMEYVKTQEYWWAGSWGYVVTYTGSECTSEECPTWLDPLHDLSDEHARYTVQVDAAALDESDSPVEEITVTVSHDDREVITLVGYKINR